MAKYSKEELMSMEVNAYAFYQEQQALIKAKRLLKKASEYLCADEDSPFFGQGDYCKCGAYVGRGDKHERGCLYVKIKKFLKGQ